MERVSLFKFKCFLLMYTAAFRKNEEESSGRSKFGVAWLNISNVHIVVQKAIA